MVFQRYQGPTAKYPCAYMYGHTTIEIRGNESGILWSCTWVPRRVYFVCISHQRRNRNSELITYLLDCNQLKVLISCVSRQDLCMDVVWIRSPAVTRGEVLLNHFGLSLWGIESDAVSLVLSTKPTLWENYWVWSCSVGCRERRREPRAPRRAYPARKLLIRMWCREPCCSPSKLLMELYDAGRLDKLWWEKSFKCYTWPPINNFVLIKIYDAGRLDKYDSRTLFGCVIF
jgi:hypothetical protein